MNKKIRIRIFIILIILISIIKIIQINFITNIKNKIEVFENLNNTFYKEFYTDNNEEIEINIIKKDKKIKEKNLFNTINRVIDKFLNLDKMECITINKNNYTYQKELFNKENYIPNRNLPKILKIEDEIKEEFKKGNIASVLDSFRIIYIIPTKYKNTDCYKIKTTRETFYIDKHTLYPIYLEYNQKNSNGNKEKIKIEYIFKENTVTYEDVKLPDLSKYTLIEN